MQSQFTDKAQNALAQAGRCARGLKQGYIGTEHILVGLLKEDTGVAAKVLADNGVEVDQVMEMIRDLIAFENGVAVKDKEGYSPRAARILEEAHRQAARFGQKQTGTAPASCTDQRGRECCRASAEHVGSQCAEDLCRYPDRHRTGRQSVQGRSGEKGRPQGEAVYTGTIQQRPDGSGQRRKIGSCGRQRRRDPQSSADLKSPHEEQSLSRRRTRCR